VVRLYLPCFTLVRARHWNSTVEDSYLLYNLSLLLPVRRLLLTFWKEMSFHLSSRSVQRLTKEYEDICKSPSSSWIAYPIDLHDPKVWHFVILGAKGSTYEGGMYHGKILLPDEYPMKAPNLIFETANGRFEPGKKICLSATAYHPEQRQPAWGIKSLMGAVQAFMLTDDSQSVGAVTQTDHERRRLAKQSPSYFCSQCALSNKDIASEHKLKADDPDEVPHHEKVTDILDKSYEDRVAARTRPIDEIATGSPLGVSLKEGITSLVVYLFKKYANIWFLGDLCVVSLTIYLLMQQYSSLQ